MQKALHDFWCQFNVDGVAVPAHISGQTEREDVFPNITYNVSVGDMFSTTNMVAFVWMKEKEGKSINEQRIDLFKKISQALPQEGVKLDYEDGFVMLYRNNDFLTTYNTEQIVNGHKIYGGRISYSAHVYGLM